MGETIVTCPLCCDEIFTSRKSLKYHLLNLKDNLRCSKCETKFDTLESLINHLDDHCEKPFPIAMMSNIAEPKTIKLDSIQLDPSYQTKDDSSCLEKCGDDEFQEKSPCSDSSQTEVNSFEGMDNSILSLQLIKEENMAESKHLQAPQLTLLGNNGESHILIMSHHEGEATNILSDQDIVTTQNEDGTISFTPVDHELNNAEPTFINQTESRESDEENSELYSCNTCGISFTSVLEHIQNFHNDQDVVVEVVEVGDEKSEEDHASDITLLEVMDPQNAVTPDNVIAESETINGAEDVEMKRVITETGNIVEAEIKDGLVVMKKDVPKAAARKVSKKKISNSIMEQQCVDKDGRLYTRRFVQIDKFWDKEDIKEKEEDGKYSCPHCSVAYNNSKSLCAHMRVHKPLKTEDKKNSVKSEDDGVNLFGPFKCNTCDTVFPSNKSLRLHRRMHEPVKSRPIDAPVEYPPTLDADPTLHSPTDKYHCGACDKWIHVGYRRIHDKFHQVTQDFNCDICNRKFFTAENLLMHMNVHSTEKISARISDKLLPYNCLYCNRQFARPHEKVKHERIHTGEKPHSCEICGKSFRVSYCLTLHMRTHTGARPYACQHCGKRFKAHSVYNHHLLTHSEVRRYKCPFCPKAFKTSVQLAGHKNSHTKPFSCTECNRPFASLYAVRVHTETHKRQNNLKFSCNLCGASYARAFALKDHIRAIHQDLDSTQRATQSLVLENKNLSMESTETENALSILPKTEIAIEVELNEEMKMME